MAHKKGFNEYKIIEEDNIAKIYLTNIENIIIEAIIDIDDLQQLINLNYRWRARWIEPANSYYVTTTLYLPKQNKKSKYKTIELQTIILGSKGVGHIDHKNHNTLDNRRCNLRMTEALYNVKNRGRVNSNNTTGYRNVCFYQGWYIVQLQINKKNTILGKFRDVDEAGAFAKEMRLKYYGEFAGE